MDMAHANTKDGLIVLASSNPGKLAEIQRLSLDFQVVPQSELGVQPPPEEGRSFIENALLKARFASSRTGLPAIGDDSGLEVFALNGAPGLFSARYAGCEGDDRKNLQKVLQNLSGIASSQRGARYICAMAFVRHAEDASPLVAVADWFGEISERPMGSEGYGYDSIFYLKDQGCTAAQLPFNIKQKLSNRTRALQELLQQIQNQRMMNV